MEVMRYIVSGRGFVSLVMGLLVGEVDKIFHRPRSKPIALDLKSQKTLSTSSFILEQTNREAHPNR